MKYAWFIIAAVSFSACKNNGSNTTASKSNDAPQKGKSSAKEIIIGAKLKKQQPTFQILEMDTKGDVLAVVFQYSGGCDEHEFNAHFNGGWLKSNPPKAMLTFEHLNPNNDSCRKLMKDTVVFNAKPLQYLGAKEVVILSSQNKKVSTSYKY